jgi:hypothetical protein
MVAAEGAYPGDRDRRWKWRNGDVLITDWFAGRGESLSWDTLVVAQWDMLVFAAVDQLFSHVAKEKHPCLSICFACARPISRPVRDTGKNP